MSLCFASRPFCMLLFFPDNQWPPIAKSNNKLPSSFSNSRYMWVSSIRWATLICLVSIVTKFSSGWMGSSSVVLLYNWQPIMESSTLKSSACHLDVRCLWPLAWLVWTCGLLPVRIFKSMTRWWFQIYSNVLFAFSPLPREMIHIDYIRFFEWVETTT